MTIREELRLCAATKDVNPTRDLSSAAWRVYCEAGYAQEWVFESSKNHRATFLLLIAEAL